MKSKAAGCGSISTVISSIVLLCVSSIIIKYIYIKKNEKEKRERETEKTIDIYLSHKGIQ